MILTTGMIPPIHKRFNEPEALEAIRNRYRELRERMFAPVQMLQKSNRFLVQCREYYARGYKDWMLLSAAYNCILNLEFQRKNVDLLDRKAAQQATMEFREMILSADYPEEAFLGQSFERCIFCHQSTVLCSWGFHPRVQSCDPKVVESFLRDRMKHFDYDLPHDDLFGDPIGEWPVIPDDVEEIKSRNTPLKDTLCKFDSSKIRSGFENGAQSSVSRIKRVGRNDLCPCGSGKKYKKCCLGVEGT